MPWIMQIHESFLDLHEASAQPGDGRQLSSHALTGTGNPTGVAGSCSDSGAIS